MHRLLFAGIAGMLLVVSVRAQSDVLGPEPGRYRVAVGHDGSPRAALVQVPDGFTPAAPVVLVLHGAGESGEAFAAAHPALLDEAGRRGWVAVLPSGLPCLDGGTGNCWNARVLPPALARAQGDDVGFLRALLTAVQDGLGMEPGRVFVTGFSNGADMAQRFAAEAPDRVRAVAAVAGTVGRTQGRTDSDYAMTPTPQGPVPVMLVKGLQDDTVLFYGGVRPEGTYQVLAAAYDASFWAEANGCLLDRREVTGTNTDPFHVITYRTGCTDGVSVNLVGVRDMGHAWLDAEDGRGFDASRAVLDYFALLMR